MDRKLQYLVATEMNPSPGVILLVDDNDDVRALSRTILERKGYVVFEARDGREGLSRYEAHLDSIDLLLTDVRMPELNGQKLAEGALKLKPRLKIIFMSGGFDDAVLDERIRNGAAFLRKPFTPGVLIEKVRDVLQMSV